MPKYQQSPSSLFTTATVNPFATNEKDSSNDAINQEALETSIIYCEAKFGEDGGEIAHALVRHSENYKIKSVIDNEKSGLDSGKVLDGKPNGIPIYRDLGTALAHAGSAPSYLILGISPANGTLSPAERQLLLRSMKYRMNIASALHVSLNEDPEFAAACAEFGVVIGAVL